MMDTVLNLGLNDESVEGLAARTENPRFAWDAYRRFVQMFANVCRGIPGEQLERAIAARKESAGVSEDVELSEDDLRALVDDFKAIYRDETGEDFPQDPQEQLRLAIRAVFDSWLGKRAATYRRINHIPDDWGTACNVQQMVFGNKGDTSCSGVAFSRDEVTGAPEPSGDFLVNAQGEDVVSGVRNPSDLSEMAERMPEAHATLMEILQTLEAHYKDMQDTEFTVEEGALYMLQTRNAKRPGAGRRALRGRRRVRGAAHARGGDRHDRRGQPRRAAAPHVRPRRGLRRARQGRRRLAGRRQGADRVHARRRRRLGAARPHGGARAPVHRGRRRARLLRRAGHPHRRGRQGVARGARRARHGQAVRGRRAGAAGSTWRRGRCASATSSSRRAT